MMARIATKYVDWRITIDGIEIPWTAFTVSVGMWSGGAASIVVEPDPILDRELRPTSLVHIWMYDDLEEGDDDDKYKLWWEGEVSGYNKSKSGTSRSVSIDCMGVVSFLQKTQMYALGVGGITNSHILTGSTLLESSDAATLAVRKEIIPLELAKEDDGTEIGNITRAAAGDPVQLNFGERVLNVLSYLLSFNAVGRLNAVRRDLFGKITTIRDHSIGRMIPRVVAQPYFEQALAGVESGGSLLDLVQTMSGALFYDFVSTTGPIKRDAYSNMTQVNRYYYLGTDPFAKEKNLYAIPAFNFRNDYFFTPKLYYALPPACNTIFPEFNINIGLLRTFFDDSTRVVVNTTLGADLSVVAPDQIFRFSSRKLTPGEFWSNNADGIKMEGQARSPYENAGLNLFAAASDLELERGILCPQITPDFEVFSAVSNLFDLNREEDITRMQNILREIGDLTKASAKVEERLVSKERAYVYALKAIADYQYKLLRYKRDVSLQLDGHRWLVPGLPMTILDTDQSYVALLTSHTFAVDAEGNETSTVGIDYARPFPEINPYFVKKLEEEQTMLNENEKNLSALESIVDDKKAQARAKAASFTEELSEARRREVASFARIERNLSIGAETEDLRNQFIARTRLAPIVRQSETLKALRRDARAVSDRIKSDPGFSSSRSRALEQNIEALDAAMESPEADFVETVNGLVKSLSDSIVAYYDQAILNAQKATAELSPTVPQIYGAADQSNKLATSIGSAEFDDSVFAEDYFAPPVFANLDLIDLKTSSQFYQELVGSKPFAVVEGQPAMASPSIANLKIECYRRFLEFADEMNKVFPVYGTEKASTAWGRKIEQPETAESTRRWEERNYLRREGLVSMREFAKRYRLEIKREHAAPPTVKEFLTLIPSSYGNSIFDKIVDEFTLLPRDVTVKVGTGGATTTIHKDSDDAIKKLRASVRDPMLFAENRQEALLRYSRRHFGSRAFDGR